MQDDRLWKLKITAKSDLSLSDGSFRLLCFICDAAYASPDVAAGGPIQISGSCAAFWCKISLDQAYRRLRELVACGYLAVDREKRGASASFYTIHTPTEEQIYTRKNAAINQFYTRKNAAINQFYTRKNAAIKPILYPQKCGHTNIYTKELSTKKREERARAREHPPTSTGEQCPEIDRIPTLPDILKFAQSNGITEHTAKRFFTYHDEANLWKRNGQVIKWPVRLLRWANEDREKGGPGIGIKPNGANGGHTKPTKNAAGMVFPKQTDVLQYADALGDYPCRVFAVQWYALFRSRNWTLKNGKPVAVWRDQLKRDWQRHTKDTPSISVATPAAGAVGSAATHNPHTKGQTQCKH